MPDTHFPNTRITPEARDQLDDLCRWSGGTKTAIASRIIAWVHSQPEDVRSLVCRYVPESIEPDYFEFLQQRRKASEGASGRRRPTSGKVRR